MKCLVKSTTRHGMDMKIRDADEGIFKLVGYTPGSLTGTSFYSFIHPQDSMQVGKEFSRMYVQGVTETNAYRLLCQDGSLVWVLTTGRVVCKRGKTEKEVVCRHIQISEHYGRQMFAYQESQCRREIIAVKRRRETLNTSSLNSIKVNEGESPVPVILHRRDSNQTERFKLLSNSHLLLSKQDDINLNYCDAFNNIGDSSVVENVSSNVSKVNMLDMNSDNLIRFVIKELEKCINKCTDEEDEQIWKEGDLVEKDNWN